MAEKRGFTNLPGAGIFVMYSSDANNYFEVPGCDNFDIPQGERESREIKAFGGTRASVGARGIADVTINVSAYAPQHPIHQQIRNDYDANNPGNWRIETEQQVLGKVAAKDADKIGLTDAGVVEIDGASPDFSSESIQAGHVIRFSNTFYIISKIDVDGTTATVTVVNSDGTPIDTAVTKVATGWEVLNPALRWSFTGQGKNIGQATAGVDADVSSTIVVTPSAAVSKPSLVYQS